MQQPPLVRRVTKKYVGKTRVKGKRCVFVWRKMDSFYVTVKMKIVSAEIQNHIGYGSSSPPLSYLTCRWGGHTINIHIKHLINAILVHDWETKGKGVHT